MNADEILAAVQIHYKLNDKHEWEENPRPYREKWISLLEAIGEKQPYTHDLPPPIIKKIHDIHELPPPPFKPVIN